MDAMNLDTKEVRYDLLVITDATASMGSYLRSLHTSLPQIISISELTGCFERIGLLAYRDYCDRTLLDWSGWLEQGDTEPDLVKKARGLVPDGGGDGPEATKTGLAKAYTLMRPEATTIVLLYTDAPPHFAWNATNNGKYCNYEPERKGLAKKGNYDGVGSHFIDWVSAGNMFKGERKAKFFCILDDIHEEEGSYYNYLSAVTGGACLYLDKDRPEVISKLTIELLLAWMGVEKKGVDPKLLEQKLNARLTRYIHSAGLNSVTSESDKNAAKFFQTVQYNYMKPSEMRKAIAKTDATPEVLKKHLPKKPVPVKDFGQRWKTDENYQKRVVRNLMKIIQDDVTAVTLNPVFGSLWRIVAADRSNPARDELISAFGLQVERIAGEEKKAAMKQWLEESYDYTADVLEAINSVPESERFPCVCVDPTLRFVKDGDAEDRPMTDFTRDELMEIGRSCDYRILRRLGRLLTRLTYINSEAEMPEHIAKMSHEDVPRIPMALSKKRTEFWKMLLHIVLPGTMLGERPGTLLAALSLRLGIEPLREAATSQMLRFRDKWNDIEVPETWSVGCLGLILSADKAHRENQPDAKPLLKENDRQLFEAAVGFRLLENNMEAPLTAKVGWQPDKTTQAIGPLVKCGKCKYPRSVTIMGPHGRCGMCLVQDWASEKEKQKCIDTKVSVEDGITTPATWVECFMKDCRAQYVVYCVEKLNVRPKCHYCRQRGNSEDKRLAAPAVECKKCRNRVIWPKEYRPIDFSEAQFLCVKCEEGGNSIVDVGTNAKKLAVENTLSWLIKDNSHSDTAPFANRSLFYYIKSVGTDKFVQQYTLFPQKEPALAYNGKPIHNPDELLGHLRSLVERRVVERVTCSLCFSDFRTTDLNPACGRRGCHQTVCRDCLNGWYGINGAGRIINVAALACPFCRRRPTASTLHKYGMGIHALGNLNAAVDKRGEWVYAWCKECGDAREFVERVCARGPPPEVEEWKCDPCKEELTKGHAVKVGYCPGCGVATQKTSGCNHIECAVAGCGVHWCYKCGLKFSESDIYEHMEAVHGSIYDDEEELLSDGEEMED